MVRVLSTILGMIFIVGGAILWIAIVRSGFNTDGTFLMNCFAVFLILGGLVLIIDDEK